VRFKDGKPSLEGKGWSRNASGTGLEGKGQPSRSLGEGPAGQHPAAENRRDRMLPYVEELRDGARMIRAENFYRST